MAETTCPKCEGEMKDGKCHDCGAWTDSYGLVHAECCQGGFHDGDCPCEDEPAEGKKKGRRKRS